MGATSNVEGSGMPSFSRAGRNSSNRNELATVNRVFESTRAKDARERPAFSYQSLADTASRAKDYATDLGRGALISSSPRLDDASPSENKAKEGLAFQRIVRWTSLPGQEYDPHKPQDGARAGARAATEDKKKAPQKERPNYFFLATERGAPNDYLEQFNKQVGKLAPPIGYYNAKLDLTKPAGPKLGYIVQVDRPHAPTFMAETLVNETLAKSKKELTLTGKAPQQPVSITPRTAVRLLRDKNPAVTDLSQYSALNTSQKLHRKVAESPVVQPRQEDETRQEDERAQTAELPNKEAVMSPVMPDSKTRPRTSTPTTGSRIFDKTWDASHITIDMKGRTARNKGETGQSTCTGFQMTVAQSADVWYRPSYEVMEITQKRVATPDLTRSGKDHNDQILRLGFQLPETLAQAPYYSAVQSAMDWSAMPKWYAATNLMDNKTTVQIDKQTERRSITLSGSDTGLSLQYRHPTRSTSTIARKKHPTYPHVPGPDMKKSSSAHGNVAPKSIVSQLDYNPSHRLQTNRTVNVLRWNKMGSRRPLVRYTLTLACARTRTCALTCALTPCRPFPYAHNSRRRTHSRADQRRTLATLSTTPTTRRWKSFAHDLARPLTCATASAERAGEAFLMTVQRVV